MAFWAEATRKRWAAGSWRSRNSLPTSLHRYETAVWLFWFWMVHKGCYYVIIFHTPIFLKGWHMRRDDIPLILLLSNTMYACIFIISQNDSYCFDYMANKFIFRTCSFYVEILNIHKCHRRCHCRRRRQITLPFILKSPSLVIYAFTNHHEMNSYVTVC